MAALKKRVKQPEEMKRGSKGTKGVMPTHYAAESSGLKKTPHSPKQPAKSKPKSLAKKKIVKK